MFYVLSSLALQCCCVEPALWLTLFSNVSAPHLTQFIQAHAIVLLSSISATVTATEH